MSANTASNHNHNPPSSFPAPVLSRDTEILVHEFVQLQAHCNARLNVENYQPILKLLNLLEKMQRHVRQINQENATLNEQKQRFLNQIRNFETELTNYREENESLISRQAALESQIHSLKVELAEYKQRFDKAKAELQSAAIGPADNHLRNTENNNTGGSDSEESVILRYHRSYKRSRSNQSRHRRSSSLQPQQQHRRSNKRFMGVVEEEHLDKMDEEENNSIPTPPKQKRLDNIRAGQTRAGEHQLMERVNAASNNLAAGPLVPQQQSTPKREQGKQSLMNRNRSMSESNIMADEKKKVVPLLQPCLSAKNTMTTSTMDMRNSPLGGIFSGWTKGRPIDQCAHNFVQTNNIFTAAIFRCHFCVRSLGMSYLKCTECRMNVHKTCSQLAPLPCVPPLVPTPQRVNPRQRARLADLCPQSQPKIPGQLIRCAVALEKGFLGCVGLYRVPGSDSEVKKLWNEFNSKYVPKLDRMEPETITGFIKKFLRDLREPLIPTSSFIEFWVAAANKNDDQLKTAIETLPIPNRDTLAYLCAHWQKVAMRSNENQMPVENLARVLGPTVAGTQSKVAHLKEARTLVGPGSAGGSGTPLTGSSPGHDPQKEAIKQVEILKALLKLDHIYWTSFYDFSANNLPQN